MKRIIFLIALFIFIYPIDFRFLPLSLDRILQVFGFVLFLTHLIIKNKNALKLVNSKWLHKYLKVTFLLLIMAFFAQTHIGSDLSFIKHVLGAFLNVFSAYLIFILGVNYNKDINLMVLLYYLVLLGVIQTLISAFFFMNPAYLEMYFSLLKESSSEGLLNRISLISYRFIGIGSQFFGGGITYGITLFSIIILEHTAPYKLLKNRFFYFLFLFLIIVGGLLTARTFFIPLGMSMVLLLLLKSNNIIDFLRVNINVLFGASLLLILMFVMGDLFFDAESFQRVSNFVFEIFINASEEKSLETGSTNRLLEMYEILPQSKSTWWFGDGKMLASDGGYYMNTDVGYLRLIFYFGLPATLFFVFVQYKYYKILSKASNSSALKYFFLMLLILFLIVNFKGLHYNTTHITIFLVFMILGKKEGVKNYYRF